MHDPLLHPFARPARPEGEYLRIVRAEGASVWDDGGRRYVDAIANLWCCQVGHGRPEIADAVADQLRRLDCYNTFDPFSNDVAVAAAEAIRAWSPLPDGRVLLGTSGSDAVDSAIKLARTHHDRLGRPERQLVLRRGRGYHGTNLGGTSVQGLPANRAGWGDLVPHVAEIDPDDIEDAARLFAAEGDRIAAAIVEPVQGAGGVHPPAPGYLEALERLCRQHGALLIADEVICGFGRTGARFACERYGIAPDLVVFAKGVTSGYQPLGGVIVSSAVADALAADPDWVLRTGYTYSGHPAAAAAALANLRILADEALVERAEEIGRVLDAGLASLVADGVGVAHRGVGGIWALELGRDPVPVRNRLLGLGVIARPVGTAIALCPPLSVPLADLDHVLDALARAVPTA